MATGDLLQVLQKQLSPISSIFSDSSNPDFQVLLRRWSDTDIEVPSAIVLPASESDCQRTILWAREHHVPFVAKAGGHSPWSMIKSPGVIIDLSQLSGVTVDKASSTATITGAVLSQDVTRALAHEDLFTAIGNGNTVGAIPYFLGGGNNPFLPLTGYGSDSIVAARLITSNGELISVSATENADLFWAIRGAGQFFGIVTSLTIQAYPLSKLGTADHTIWSGIFVFPLDRAEEVARTMSALMDDQSYSTSGLIMIATPPPKFAPMIAIAGKFFGSADEVRLAYKPLYDLKPAVTTNTRLTVEHLNDSLDNACAKGDLKRYLMVGMHEFNINGFLKSVEWYQQLTSECPDASQSMFNFHWHSRSVKRSVSESAMAFQDIRMWQSVVLWYTDPGSTEKAVKISEDVIEVMREGQKEEQYVDFTSSTREGPVERRYGRERLGRLRALKGRWDPDGMFTRQFL